MDEDIESKTVVVNGEFKTLHRVRGPIVIEKGKVPEGILKTMKGPVYADHVEGDLARIAKPLEDAGPVAPEEPKVADQVAAETVAHDSVKTAKVEEPVKEEKKPVKKEKKSKKK
jgi:hypothetical protein